MFKNSFLNDDRIMSKVLILHVLEFTGDGTLDCGLVL